MRALAWWLWRFQWFRVVVVLVALRGPRWCAEWCFFETPLGLALYEYFEGRGETSVSCEIKKRLRVKAG